MNTLYRAILHGPMSWKTSHQSAASLNTAPYLVIFEPISSVVMLSQGTLLIPQISIQLNSLKSQVLSVFVYSDSTTAKQLVSELYTFSDKKKTVFDAYNSEKVLKLLMKSLASFHLPLEIVLKRIDCNPKNRAQTKDLTTQPHLNNFKSNFNRQGQLEGYRLRIQPVTNTVTNNVCNKYTEEPRSVKSSVESLESYTLRVGFEEGFSLLTTSTDLIQKLFQAVERKGARVNRLSLNFYKINKPKSLPKSTANLTQNPKKLLTRELPIKRSESNTIKQKQGANLKLCKPFYTPKNDSFLLYNTNLTVNTDNTKNENDKSEKRFKKTNFTSDFDVERSNLTTILRSLTNAIDKNTEAINSYGSVDKIHQNPIDTQEMVKNELNTVTPDKKEDKILNKQLTSMSTGEFFGYESQTSLSHSNKFEKSFSFASDSFSFSPTHDLQNELTDLKLENLQLKNHEFSQFPSFELNAQITNEEKANTDEDFITSYSNVLNNLSKFTPKNDAQNFGLEDNSQSSVVESDLNRVNNTNFNTFNNLNDLNNVDNLDDDFSDDEDSSKSDLNVIIDGYNELSNKNESLERELGKYKQRVVKLKRKISSLKSVHKFELDDLVNSKFSNEERLRTTINENNITIKMMEEERIRLNELVEQHKSIINRVNREKSEALEKVKKLEDGYHKLQFTRELDRSERQKLAKIGLENEHLKSENEVLNTKLRALGEKLQKLQQSDSLKSELVGELTEKVELFGSEKVRIDQLIGENKGLKLKEIELKDQLEALRLENLSLKNDFSFEKSRNTKMHKIARELENELNSLKDSFNSREEREQKLESKMSMLKNNNAVLLRNLENSRSELENLRSKLTQETAEKVKTESKYRQIQSNFERLETINQKLNGELLGLRKVMEDKDSEISRLITQLNGKENELKSVKSESNELKKKLREVIREYNYVKTSYEAVEVSLQKFKRFDEALRFECENKSQENQELLRQLETMRFCLGTLKADLEAKIEQQEDLCAKLLARLFWLACSFNKLNRENSINKLKVTITSQKKGSSLTRALIRSVLISKAKVAKRNCQILRIVSSLQMTGPTTCSMIISKINSLISSTSFNLVDNVVSDHDNAVKENWNKVKNSFMKHSLEKDKEIRKLQSKLESVEQLKENQQFLLEENRKLSEQILQEQNNLQQVQDALNKQITHERFAFETESKSLYKKQYQLIQQNNSLLKENQSLKSLLHSQLNTNSQQSPDNAYRSTKFNSPETNYSRLLY